MTTTGRSPAGEQISVTDVEFAGRVLSLVEEFLPLPRNGYRALAFVH